jgi:hypothetical protein
MSGVQRHQRLESVSRNANKAAVYGAWERFVQGEDDIRGVRPEHRRYVVNLSRVREVERRDKGELVLVMDDHENTMVRVSRRNARAVRRALGI